MSLQDCLAAKRSYSTFSYVVILSPSHMANTELSAGREGSDLKGSPSQLSADFLHNFLVILITQLNVIANSCKFSSTILGYKTGK